MTMTGDDATSRLSRRAALGGLGIAGAGLAAGLAAAASPAPAAANPAPPATPTGKVGPAGTRARKPIDFDDATANLDAYVKLVGDVGGKDVVGAFSGHVFGVVESRILRPLFGFEGFGIGRYERQPDGSYRNIWREVGYYKDIESGRILERWPNPYSDETVDVLHVQNDPVNLVVTNQVPQFPPKPGLEFRFGNYGRDQAFILPWLVDRAGDWASCMYDVHGRRPNPLPPAQWPRESSGEFLRVSETFQMGGPLSQLEDPEVTSVRQVGGWQRIADWLPWMLMDQRPGHLFYRCVTRKYGRVEDLPRHVLDYTERHFPQFLKAPDGWVAKNVSSFDVYKAQRKPAPPRAPRS
ncbi:MAG: DUF1838 domain-containing protein [Steroidobacteraceae bacterium]|jgi:hypothetical protein|nr:DUF1838 domain-containing protein [Steroidobacteraceae bacterium]